MIDMEFSETCDALIAASSGAMRVYGVRRAGQHAIIDWILRNSGQREQIFLNNRRLGQSPLRLGGQGASMAKTQALAKRISGRLAKGQRPFLLISYEHGFSPSAFQNGTVSSGFSNAAFQHEVLITRSFSNWLPSYMRLVQSQNPQRPLEGFDNVQAIIKGVEAYKAHMRAVCSTAHLHISFDNWVRSAAYRLEKLGALGLPAVDNTLGRAQPFGGGSSFTGVQQPPEAEALTTRWRAMQGQAFAAQFITLALEDAPLLADISELYPEDPARLRTIIAQT